MISTLVFTVFLGASDTPVVDAWLTTKAKIALATKDVESGRIHVDTRFGVVTLFGSVPTAEDKHKAETIVAELARVKRVDNQLEVVAAKINKVVDAVDDVIKKDVEKALGKSKVKVDTVSAGVVTLRGKTTDIAEHAAAVDAVQRVAGVRRIETRVEVENDAPVTTFYYPTQSTRPTDRQHDAWLTAEVRERFLANAEIPVFDLNIDTKDAEVTLAGRVPSDKVKEAAVAEAKKVKGVKAVENNLIVSPPTAAPSNAKVSDEQIAGQVKKILAEENAKNIGVSVNDGTVKLTGQVQTEEQRAFLGYYTRASTGARAVKNDISVMKTMKR